MPPTKQVGHHVENFSIAIITQVFCKDKDHSISIIYYDKLHNALVLIIIFKVLNSHGHKRPDFISYFHVTIHNYYHA